MKNGYEEIYQSQHAKWIQVGHVNIVQKEREKDLQLNGITLEDVDLSRCFLSGGSAGVLICGEASLSKAFSSFFSTVVSCICERLLCILKKF